MTAPAEGPRWRRWLRVALLRGPFWESSRSRRALRLGAFAGYLYLGVMVVLLSLENRLLFVAASPGFPWQPAPPGAGVEELRLQSSDGNAIVAWWLEPAGWLPGQGAIHYSHGNGCNVSQMIDEAQRWHAELGRAVLLYDYPGYGQSSGRPSEAGCYAAGEAAYRWLVETKGVPSGEVILIGSSLGAGIAAELATRHEHRLLLLQAPFTSFPDIAQTRVPFFPVRWLARNKFDNREKVARAKAPVFVVHGDADEVIPLAMGRRVFEAAREPKRFVELAGQGHWYPTQREYFEAVRAFLAEVKAGG